jgi:hypothetical protein
MAIFLSCNEDEEAIIPFEERDRAEQQIEDNNLIVNYLSTHYYNSGFFETGANNTYLEIVITELQTGEDVPVGQTLLIEDVEIFTEEYLDVVYEYYVLRINQGVGEAPKFTDLVLARYEGISLESEEVFDGVVTPVSFGLQGNGITTFGTIKAWQLVMPLFNSALDFALDNGSVNYNNYGLGVMFVPSGLAYFSGSATGSSYDNLIFKFELLQVEEVDHDNDGLPSYIEDLDGNLEVENDDTDGDGFENFIDANDDGDDVSTINELMPNSYIVDTNIGDEEPVLAPNEYERSRSENEGIITINTVTAVDSNNDGIPDYLDETITINYNEDDDS